MSGYFWSIFFGSFVLEDVALISAIALMNENKLSFTAAFIAGFLGICIGDLGLYAIGYLGSRFGLEQRFQIFKKHRLAIAKFKESQAMSVSIFISRAIPGTRIPTYVASGFFRYSLWKFIWLTIVSVALWVWAALLGGRSLQQAFMTHWLLGLALCLVCFQILKFIIPRLSDRWLRKSLRHSWRQWLHFEFWPALLFYLPIVPLYIYLSLKHRSFFMPFYANPHLCNGGLIGESKWDFLHHLDPTAPSTLRALRLDPDLDFLTVREKIDTANFNFPFIIKPDVGQRGFGVRIIRNDFDLTEYLLLSHFPMILQELSLLPNEAGVFYIRPPHAKQGHLFSITDKKFPTVVGDGQSKLGDLILKDLRARIIASVYFSRLKDTLDTIPESGQIIPLSECGNHCQGAIFENGQDLKSPELLRAIEAIAQKIPDFYFGRFDLRYKSRETLMAGKDFEIVEINGAGSEATHIWDKNTSLWQAYKTLGNQWSTLFQIGHAVRDQNPAATKLHLTAFFKECSKVFFRKETLSTSS